MAGQYIGKTIEDALNKALIDLQVSRDDVDYRVIEQPSKGFFGLIGGRPAKIEVSLREKAVADTVASAATENSASASATASSATTTASEESATAAEAEGATATAPRAEVAEATSVATDAPDESERLAIAEQFLRDVFAAMHIEVAIERSESVEGTVYGLVGDNLGILIGKHGQTLDSLQYLANLAANRGADGERVRVILDIENYRARREETLVRLAGHLAEKACRIGQEVHLEPMNRHERKIIHMALQDNRRVSTFSAGDEPRRYVVIAPKKSRRRRPDRSDRSERSDRYGRSGGYADSAARAPRESHASERYETPDSYESSYERGEY